MPIPALVGVLAPVIGTLVDRLIPDKAEAERTKAQLEADLVKTANEVNLAQIEVNKTEAQHASVFVAGWRPGIGWVCVAGLTWAFIGAPVASWAAALYGIETKLPELQLDYLFELVMAMLGMAGLRSFEKLKGVAR